MSTALGHGARRHRHHFAAILGARDRSRAGPAYQAHQRSEFSRQVSLIKKKNRTLPPFSKAFAEHLARDDESFLNKENDPDR
jgi:hypothetical protein